MIQHPSLVARAPTPGSCPPRSTVRGSVTTCATGTWRRTGGPRLVPHWGYTVSINLVNGRTLPQPARRPLSCTKKSSFYGRSSGPRSPGHLAERGCGRNFAGLRRVPFLGEHHDPSAGRGLNPWCNPLAGLGPAGGPVPANDRPGTPGRKSLALRVDQREGVDEADGGEFFPGPAPFRRRGAR